EITARGEAAEEALRAVVELIECGFASDLVPEPGSAAVEGIAIGKALVWVLADAVADADDPAPIGFKHARVEAAFRRAIDDVTALIASLPQSEGQLFEPEIAILNELRPRVLERIVNGEAPGSAIHEETREASTDLLADAAARLLEALAGETESLDAR